MSEKSRERGGKLVSVRLQRFFVSSPYVRNVLRSGLRTFYSMFRVDPAAEYVKVTRRRYREIENETVARVLDDETVLSFHVGSPHKVPNLNKVKTRIFSTVDFIKRQLASGEMQRATFLDVGGSSSLFYDLMEIETSRGHIANVLEEHLKEAKEKGWGWIKMEDDRIELEDDRFDYCLSFECLEHSHNPLLLLRELLRVSRKGVFLSIPWRNQTGVVKKQPGAGPAVQHVFELSPGDLERLVSHAGGKVVRQEPLSTEAKMFSLNPAVALFRKRAGYGSPNVLLAQIKRLSHD